MLGCECLKFEGSEKQRIKKELVFFEVAVMSRVLFTEGGCKNLTSGRIDIGAGVVGDAVTF